MWKWILGGIVIGATLGVGASLVVGAIVGIGGIGAVVGTVGTYAVGTLGVGIIAGGAVLGGVAGGLIKSYKDEPEPEKFYSSGLSLYNQGRYAEAAEKFGSAYNKCSSGYKNEATFKVNRDKAQVEVDAINLSSEGDRLFNQGKYVEAQSKYQEAYNKSQITKEKDIYSTNKENAQREVEAQNLNNEGNKLFDESKYHEAITKYQEAWDKATIYLDAKEYLKYGANKRKAQVELDAINLNREGERLFSEGKYHEAITKYQEADAQSNIIKEKDIYNINIKKAQNIIDTLSLFDALWNQAWDAENDEENDRSEEAKELFQKALKVAEQALKFTSNDPEIKNNIDKCTLKIEGNKDFNDALELRNKGNELWVQKNFLVAEETFKHANTKQSAAKKKFEKGSEYDIRFKPCADLSQEQLDTVNESLNINHDYQDNYQLDITGNHDDYTYYHQHT